MMEHFLPSSILEQALNDTIPYTYFCCCRRCCCCCHFLCARSQVRPFFLLLFLKFSPPFCCFLHFLQSVGLRFALHHMHLFAHLRSKFIQGAVKPLPCHTGSECSIWVLFLSEQSLRFFDSTFVQWSHHRGKLH